MSGDLFQRQAMKPMQDESRAHFRREPIQRTIQLFNALIRVRLLGGVAIGSGLKLRVDTGDLHQLRATGLAQRMLLSDMLRNGEQIGFRGADRFVIRNAQHAQEHFLDDVWNIRKIANPP